MDTTTDSTTDFMQESKRPDFLSVICILTWVLCGILFIFSVLGILSNPSPEEQYEQIEEIRKHSAVAADRMEEALAEQTTGGKLLNTALSLVALGLSALGAYLMWQLKKRGFFVYLAGELLPYLGFAFGGAKAIGAMGASFKMSENATLGVVIGIMLFFDAVFIVMYALNLKHMK